jgi:hypothetical protein
MPECCCVVAALSLTRLADTALPLLACVCVSLAGASSFLEHRAWFGMLSGIGIVTSFSSTLMFTALGSFFNRISDPGARRASGCVSTLSAAPGARAL